MLVLASAAAHSGLNSSAAVALIAAVLIAMFWKAIVKFGLAVLALMFIILIFGGASAIVSILH